MEGPLYVSFLHPKLCWDVLCKKMKKKKNGKKGSGLSPSEASVPQLFGEV